MSTTLPNLPALSASPAHTLTDADIVHVNHSASPGVGGDRKATLAELRVHIVPTSFEYLHKPDFTGDQLLVQTPSWDGSSGSFTARYGVLRKDTLGIYTMDVGVISPTAPSAWTSPGTAILDVIGGSGSGTGMWNDFLAQLKAEETGGYGLVQSSAGPELGDYPPPIVVAASAELPAVLASLGSTTLGVTPAEFKLRLVIRNTDNSPATWDKLVKVSKQTSFRFTISTRLPS